ncbi:MAG: DUF5689 domain-containing protein [Chitinophagaceae bacterium]|jgi:hypothetical protein
MKINYILSILIILGLFSSCLKKKNDSPEINANYDPALAVNFNLGKLNLLTPPEGAPIKIDSDWTVVCVVRADDASGNIYNQLIVEDSSGGIALLLSENSLYTRYPIGKKLYLKIKGLYLGNNHGTPQLGATPVADNSGILQVSDIQAKLLNQIIITSNTTIALPPIEVSLVDLTLSRNDLVNRLLLIKNVELNNPTYDNIYADPLIATSIKLRDCSGASIVLRTSNYASFQNYPTPFGKGNITAIYSLYNNAGQLTIRDTTDVKMGLARCDGSVFQESELISIQSLRKFYQGKDSAIGNYKINGIVTSDVDNKNFGTGNIIIQQGNYAITVYFGSSANKLPQLGDSIELNVNGAIITKYNDALEIKNIKTTKIKTLARNKFIQPITLTIATLNANFSIYESVLVKINNAKITSSGNFAGSNTLNDATGTITLYTSNSATFANIAVPTITKTFQGIATPYGTTNEIKIRNPSVDIY